MAAGGDEYRDRDGFEPSLNDGKESQSRLGEVASYPVPGSGSPEAGRVNGDGRWIFSLSKPEGQKKEIHFHLPPRPLLSLNNREGLLASIQRRAREEEINGELVGDRDRGDG